MSTVPPSVSRALEARVRATGAGLLDAPVSGSVALAESGQLTIMAGGDEADLERARPVLDALAKRVFHLGPLGSGAVMKLAVNNIIFGLNQVLAESLVLAERAGVERATAYEVFASSAIAAPFVLYKRAAFVEPETTPPAFALELAAKDLGLILELGAQVGAALPQAALNLAAGASWPRATSPAATSRRWRRCCAASPATAPTDDRSAPARSQGHCSHREHMCARRTMARQTDYPQPVRTVPIRSRRGYRRGATSRG